MDRLFLIRIVESGEHRNCRPCGIRPSDNQLTVSATCAILDPPEAVACGQHTPIEEKSLPHLVVLLQGDRVLAIPAITLSTWPPDTVSAVHRPAEQHPAAGGIRDQEKEPRGFRRANGEIATPPAAARNDRVVRAAIIQGVCELTLRQKKHRRSILIAWGLGPACLLLRAIGQAQPGFLGPGGP